MHTYIYIYISYDISIYISVYIVSQIRRCLGVLTLPSVVSPSGLPREPWLPLHNFLQNCLLPCVSHAFAEFRKALALALPSALYLALPSALLFALPLALPSALLAVSVACRIGLSTAFGIAFSIAFGIASIAFSIVVCFGRFAYRDRSDYIYLFCSVYMHIYI